MEGKEIESKKKPDWINGIPVELWKLFILSALGIKELFQIRKTCRFFEKGTEEICKKELALLSQEYEKIFDKRLKFNDFSLKALIVNPSVDVLDKITWKRGKLLCGYWQLTIR